MMPPVPSLHGNAATSPTCACAAARKMNRTNRTRNKGIVVMRDDDRKLLRIPQQRKFHIIHRLVTRALQCVIQNQTARSSLEASARDYASCDPNFRCWRETGERQHPRGLATAVGGEVHRAGKTTRALARSDAAFGRKPVLLPRPSRYDAVTPWKPSVNIWGKHVARKF